MTLKRKNFGDFKYFHARERPSIVSISVAVFKSDSCKEGEMSRIEAKLTDMRKYLLSTDESNNYRENKT